MESILHISSAVPKFNFISQENANGHEKGEEP